VRSIAASLSDLAAAERSQSRFRAQPPFRRSGRVRRARNPCRRDNVSRCRARCRRSGGALGTRAQASRRVYYAVGAQFRARRDANSCTPPTGRDPLAETGCRMRRSTISLRCKDRSRSSHFGEQQLRRSDWSLVCCASGSPCACRAVDQGIACFTATPRPCNARCRQPPAPPRPGLTRDSQHSEAVGPFRGAGFAREPGTHEQRASKKGSMGRCSWFPGPPKGRPGMTILAFK